MKSKPVIRIQKDDFDPAKENELLRRNAGEMGALVSFTGICRSENHRINALELEHYPQMAEKQIGEIAEMAAGRWELAGLTIIHRFGIVRAGENIVLVCAAAKGRDAAFEAARFVMDYLKTDAPFWKKEIARDESGTRGAQGDTRGAQGGKWVDSKPRDESAKAKWENKN